MMNSKRIYCGTFCLSGMCIVSIIALSCGKGGSGFSISGNTILKSGNLGSNSLNLRATDQHSMVDTVSCSATACVTPTSVTGKAYYAGIIVGGGSSGGTGTSVGPIIGTVTRPDLGSSYNMSDLLDFDFSQGISMTGSASGGGGPEGYPADANAYAQSVIIYFGYIDTTFLVSSGALAGSHTIRLVMADVDNTEMKKGDLLYKGSGDSSFKWCVANTDCNQSTRPSSPIQVSSIASFSNNYGQGNPTIPSFYVRLTNSTPVQLTKDNLSTGTWIFTVDFNMENAIQFSSNPTGLTQTYALVSAFSITAEPSDESGGFEATLTAQKQ